MQCGTTATRAGTAGSVGGVRAGAGSEWERRRRPRAVVLRQLNEALGAAAAATAAATSSPSCFTGRIGGREGGGVCGATSVRWMSSSLSGSGDGADCEGCCDESGSGEENAASMAEGDVPGRACCV